MIFGVVFACFYDRVFPLIMGILQRFRLVSSKYAGWQTNSYYTTLDRTGGINISILIYSTFALVIAVLLHRKYKNTMTRYLLLINFLMLCLAPFMASYANFGRINTYFRMFAIFTMPLFDKVIPVKKAQRRNSATCINVMFLVCYWLVTYQITDFTGTGKYLFFWQ